MDAHPPKPGPIRLLIADDHDVVRKGIVSVLSSGDVEVCGEARNGSEGVGKALELMPDLVILDRTMPVMGGFDAAIEICRLLPHTPILFYSIYEGKALIKEAKRIGVRGFVSKNRTTETLLKAVNVLVLEKGTFFPDSTELSALRVNCLPSQQPFPPGSTGILFCHGATQCLTAVIPASSPLQPQWPWGVKHSASAVSRLLLILTPVVDKGRSHAGPREKKNMRILFANEHGCALQLGVAIAFNWTSRIVGETSSKANTTSGVFRLSARTL